MKGAPALLLVLLLGVTEGRNIAHNVLERSIEHTRPQLERQDGFMERPGPPSPRKQLAVNRLDHPDHDFGHGEHARMAPGMGPAGAKAPLPPLSKDSKALHAPRIPPQHQVPEHEEGASLERFHPATAHVATHPHDSPRAKGLLDIVTEMVKPQLIKPTSTQTLASTHRALRDGLLPPKTMTPHGMMVPRQMRDHDEHHDHHERHDEHHDHHERHDDHNHHDDRHDHEGKHDHDEDSHDEAGTQTDFDEAPDIIKGMIATVKAKFLDGSTETAADLKEEIASLKTQLGAAVEAYKEAHGQDDEDVTTDTQGNTVLIIVRAPDMTQVADAAFAGTGSGVDGEFTKEDWDAAVHNTQDMCAEDFETLCGDNADSEFSSGSSDSSDSGSSDSKDHHHHHWFRRLMGKQGPPPPPPSPRGQEQAQNGQSPPPQGNSGPIGFGSRENDMCLKSQRTSASAPCRVAMAQTEAIYRDLDSRGMAPHPPMHMHAHGSIFGIVLVLAACCCCMKCRRCRRVQKLKMKRTLAALSTSNQAVKAAVEDAAGVQLPSPGWKLKVALAVDANPELKAAIAQVEQNYVPTEQDVVQKRARITNPFTGMTRATGGHHGCGRRVCKFIVLLFGVMCFLSLAHHHGGAPDDQADEGPESQEQGSEDGAPPSSPMWGLLITMSVFFCAVFCLCFLCRFCFDLYKKCFGVESAAVAVNVEDEPTIVPSSVASGTVTSVTTAKYVELEKGTCKF